MSITRAQIARQLYANGGYSDFASPSSTTASQDFSTQAMSGGQTNYGGGDGSSTPTVNFATIKPPSNVNATQAVDNYQFGPKPYEKYLAQFLASGLPMGAVVNYGLRKYYDAQEKIAEDVTTARNSGYGQAIGSQYFGPVNDAMRQSYENIVGGFPTPEPTINTGGGENIIPRLPMIAETPSDIESTPSDFDLYAALEGREGMRFGKNPYAIRGTTQRFSDGGLASLRQQYKIGKLVKKITEPVKKIIKSDVGKAALAAAAVYTLGGGGNPLTAAGRGNFATANIPGYSKVKDFIGSNSMMKDIDKLPGYVKYGIPAVSIGSYFAAKKANEDENTLDEEMAQKYRDTSGLREQLATYKPFRFQVPKEYQLPYADGGRIGYRDAGMVEDSGIMQMAGDMKPRQEVADLPYDVQIWFKSLSIEKQMQLLQSDIDENMKRELRKLMGESSGERPMLASAVLGGEDRDIAMQMWSNMDSSDRNLYKNFNNYFESGDWQEGVKKIDPGMMANGGRIGYQNAGSVNSDDQYLLKRFIEEDKKHFKDQDIENLLERLERFKKKNKPESAAQGGRIGFAGGGLSEYELFKLKELGYNVKKEGTETFGGISVLKDILKVNKLAGGGIARTGYEMGGEIDPADLPMSREGFPRYEDELGEEVPYPYDNQEMASDPNPMAELFQMYLEAIRSGQIPRSTTFDQYKELINEMSFSKEKTRTMANEGGLMNLGGNEMDLRGGGFVPIGAKEKADDVPARLSKNEFVFTADAVRAAGGGDVDTGADLMYKTMKNLESRVG